MLRPAGIYLRLPAWSLLETSAIKSVLTSKGARTAAALPSAGRCWQAVLGGEAKARAVICGVEAPGWPFGWCACDMPCLCHDSRRHNPRLGVGVPFDDGVAGADDGAVSVQFGGVVGHA